MRAIEISASMLNHTIAHVIFMDVKQRLLDAIHRKLDPDIIVRILAGMGTATDEALCGINTSVIIRAAQSSREIWTLARMVIDMSGGVIGHSRGNILPAAACRRIGLPPYRQ